MDFDLKQKKFWSITRLKTSSIFRNLKVDAYPLKTKKSLILAFTFVQWKLRILHDIDTQLEQCLWLVSVAYILSLIQVIIFS